MGKRVGGNGEKSGREMGEKVGGNGEKSRREWGKEWEGMGKRVGKDVMGNEKECEKQERRVWIEIR